MAILTMLRHEFRRNDGTLNAGGKVYTYEAGTGNTPVTTYTSSAATTPNTNPIILDAKGECDLWITGQIKVNVLQSDDVQVTGWPVDNIGSGVSNNDATSRWSGTAGGTANALTITPSPSITAYAIGQSFIFKAGASANTSTTTIAVSGLSAIASQSNGAAMAGGEILANNFYIGVLDTLTTCQISKLGEATLAELGAAALAGSAAQAFQGSTLKAATTIGVGAATPAASGAGITFPSVQSASSDANTLDDYTKFTWTPSPTNLTVVGTPTYTGTGTKIGNLVYLYLKVFSTTSTQSAANSTYFAGSPYSPANVSVNSAVNGSVLSLGNGFTFTNGNVYSPTWAATSNVYVNSVFTV